MRLEPLAYTTHLEWRKGRIDDFAFIWFGRLQGVYKSKALVRKMKKVANKTSFDK